MLSNYCVLFRTASYTRDIQWSCRSVGRYDFWRGLPSCSSENRMWEDHYRCGWYQTHRCSTYISIFEGSLQPGALSLASRLFLIQLKRWNIESNKYNILNSYTRAVCGTLNTLSKSQSIKCMNFDYFKHTGFG